MRKTMAVILPAICLSLILTIPLSCRAESLSGNDAPQETEETGGDDMQSKPQETGANNSENPETKESPETKEGSGPLDKLESSLKTFHKFYYEAVLQYLNQDVEFGTDLMEVMHEINQTLSLLYDEIKAGHELDRQVSGYLLSDEEAETEAETEPETKPLEEEAMEKSLNYQSVSSANLDDVDGNLLLVIDELRIANERDAAFTETVKSLLSGIILAVTVGTGLIAGIIAFRRFR